MTDGPFTIAFVGYVTPSMSERAAAYEDAVLPLLDRYGARVLYRGRRAEGEDPARPFEIHLLWFPDQHAFDGYLVDKRRRALLDEFGEVFSHKQVVRMDTISGSPDGSEL